MILKWFLFVVCASGIHSANSECAAGETGPVGGPCTPCAAGTYMYKEADGAFQELLSKNRPHIVSDAADWNAVTGPVPVRLAQATQDTGKMGLSLLEQSRAMGLLCL